MTSSKNLTCNGNLRQVFISVYSSVADPDPNLDPDPSDPFVFGRPGSEPDLLVRGMDTDPDPDPSITKQK
jgi:hypothetical protein